MPDLAALLGAYNVSMLSEMVAFLRLDAREALNKRGLIDALARFLGTPKHLAAVRGHLSVRQWQTLAYHRLHAEPVSLSALLVRLTAADASEREALSDLLELLNAGCLVFVDQLEYNYKLSPTLDRMAKGEYLDLRVASFPLLLDAAEKRTAGAEAFGWVSSPPKVARTASYLEFQRECYLALRAASDGELKLTNRGLPFKTSIARLAASAAGVTVGKGGKARLSDVPVSPRLWLVLAALRAAGLFGDDNLEERAQLTAFPGATEILSRPVAEQARALFDAWLGSTYHELARVPTLDFERRLDPAAPWVDPSPHAYYGTDLPTLSRLRGARRSIVRAIQSAARGRSDAWLRLSALQTAIRADDPELLVPLRSGSPTYGGPYGRRARYYEGIRRPKRAFPDNLIRRDLDWAEVEGAYVATVVAEPLHWLGLVELGEESDGTLAAFRLTPLGRHLLLDEPYEEEDTSHGGPHLVVQPSFEIIVLDAAANLGLVAHLDDFAERASLDRAATYRLTREAAVRGFDRGHSVQWMVEILESASAAPLPQNVRFSLEEWSRLYERIHVRRRATLLVAESAAQLDAWLADPETAGLLGKRLSPTTVLVLGERRSEVERYVAKRDVGWHAHDYAMPFRRRFRLPEPTAIEPLPDADEPYLRYRLGRFAVAEGRRFRITADSIREAIAKGLPAEAIITYLQTVADGKVPDDTCLRIRGWGGLYQPLRHGQAVVVELPLGMTPSDIQRIPEVRRALLRPLGANVIALDPAGFEAARAALAERGLTVEAGLTVSRASARPEAAKSRRSMSTLKLQVLPEHLLRRYVQDAIAAGRQLVFGLTDPDGRREAVLLQPLRVFGKDGVAYVECQASGPDGAHETFDIPLALVDAVGDAAELGLA